MKISNEFRLSNELKFLQELNNSTASIVSDHVNVWDLLSTSNRCII